MRHAFTLSIVVKSFYTILLDEFTRSFCPSKYSIGVMVMLHMICSERKDFCLNFQGYEIFILKPLLLNVIEK